MAALPYMQLYIADYLADTAHLSTEEHGAYMLLMFNYWQTGKPLPKARLHRIARIPADRWPEIECVLSEFFEDGGDRWVHLRIERDMEAVHTSPRGKRLPSNESLLGYKGYVYFVTDDGLDRVKVGYSKNPWARLGELRRSYGEELRVVATVKTVERSELNVHQLLERSHLEGEWFLKDQCVSGLISAIASGELTTVADVAGYVHGYAGGYGTLTTATTNTDTDTDTDKRNTPPNPPAGGKAPAKSKPNAKAPATPAEKPARAKPKRPLPLPFLMTPEMLAWAAEKAPAVTLDRETEKFIDYWTGLGGTKADWHATWRNWIRRAQDDLERRGMAKPAAKAGTESDTDWIHEDDGV